MKSKYGEMNLERLSPNVDQEVGSEGMVSGTKWILTERTGRLL